MSSSGKIKIGISSCLLGQAVRFDAGHKRDEFIVETLGRYFEWVPICPEVELGLGVPRETLRLVKKRSGPRLITNSTEKDLTLPMRRFSKKRVKPLLELGIRGYLLKKNSPTCGMERVKVYGKGNIPGHTGRGLFADALMTAYPSLPVEEEGRLHDPVLRENWIERVFAYDALQRLLQSQWRVGDLVQFHTKHKFAILAHSEAHYRRMGRIVASAKRAPAKSALEYERELMEALRIPATRKKNTNVLVHMAGFLKTKMESSNKRELLASIEDYRQGILPLSVPLTLLAHYVRVFGETYLAAQSFLNPHPKELALRHFIL